MEDAVVAMMLMQEVDRIRYGRRCGELDCNMYLGCNEFPVSIIGAFDVLTLQEHRVLEFSQNSVASLEILLLPSFHKTLKELETCE